MYFKLLIYTALFTAGLWGIIVAIRQPLDPTFKIHTTYSLYVDCGGMRFEYYPYAYYRHFKVVRIYQWLPILINRQFALRRRILAKVQIVLSRYGGRGYLQPRRYALCSRPQMCFYYDYYAAGANGLHCNSTIEYN